MKRCTDSGGTITYKNDPVFGMGVQVTKRRPPTYLDAMFAPDIFWDGRATSKFTVPDTGEVAIQSGGGLESQSVGPPLGDAEMACEARTWPMIHAKLITAAPLALARNLPTDIRDWLARYPTYPKLFEAAYGTTEINTKRVAFAIATHERRLTSNQTPWDLWNAGDDSAMTAQQQRGFALFVDATKAKCNVCHSPPLFTDGAFHNLGFISSSFDNGREAISSLPADKGKFKTPTLRNVGLREAGGILHFGFGHGATLDAVMTAYNVPPAVETADIQIVPLNLSAEEEAAIVDFMRNALTDPRVKNETSPFDRPTLSTEP
jgi:cytochrome c peroxidase